jgi:hypothetical protein
LKKCPDPVRAQAQRGVTTLTMALSYLMRSGAQGEAGLIIRLSIA